MQGSAEGKMRDAISIAVGVAGLIWTGALLSPVAIVGWQTLNWLRSGVWEPWPLLRAMDYLDVRIPYTEWRGAQQIIVWIVELPLAIFLPCAAVGFLWLGAVALGAIQSMFKSSG